MPAPAYLIVTMHVTDPARYERYKAAAPAAVKAHGGEYLVRGGRQETLEGDWHPHRVVVLRFPSYEQALAFYNDGAYVRDVKPLREGAADYFNMVLVEGTDTPV